jgi:general secretion pathway protein C
MAPDVFRKWRFVLGFVAALLLAQTGASLTWKIADVTSERDDDLTARRKSAEKTLISSKGSAAGRAESQLDELPLFGLASRVENSSRSSAVDPAAVPKTTLALILKGIVTVEPMQRALAIIAEKGPKNEENLYSIGDKVPGNAVLSEIYADRVLLRRGGVLETLMMQLDENAGLAKKSQPEVLSGNDETIVSMGDGVHWEIDNAYLEQRLNDIPSLAREVGVEVYKENNVQEGYKLVSARGSKLLRELGLQPGDVLHEVNGVKLNTIQGGLSAYQRIRDAEEIRVVISRNGRRETRVYEVNNGG